MSTSIKSYLEDGANHSVQAILQLCKYIPSHLASLLHQESEKIGKDEAYANYNQPDVIVGRYENCREQGYVFTLQSHFGQLVHYCVFEHRNSDSICVIKFKRPTINTPTIDEIWAERKDKWDVDQSFAPNEIWDVYEYLSEDMEDEYAKYLEGWVAKVVEKKKKEESGVNNS